MFDVHCQNTQEHILKHLLDRVPLPAEAIGHLQRCRACQQHLQELREVVTALAFTQEKVPPPGLKSKVLEGIHTDASSRTGFKH